MSAALACYHCGEAIPRGSPVIARVEERDEPVCCVGCKAVAELIHAEHLNAYYEFRRPPDAAVTLRQQLSEWAHYDADDLQSRFVHRKDDAAEATVEIGGMYCSACVWLLENALKRHEAIETITVNPVTRRAVIRWNAAMPFSQLLSIVAGVGFRPRPFAAGEAEDSTHAEYRLALKRLLVAAAAGMQVMMFAVALYAGDAFGIEGGIEKFLRTVSLLVTLPIIFYSARPFYLGAWRGLRARAPGMDLPVAIAISAAFLASLHATLLDQGQVYFDSVAMFVLFLSASRFFEMRARHRSENQAHALASLLPDSAIRIRDGVEETLSIDRLRAGDVIRIRPGDVMPVDGVVEEGFLSVDESLLTGEALPVERAAEMQVLAGSINRDGVATVRVTRTGAGTSLAEVGRLLERAKADRPPVAVLADQVASYFVVGVLVMVSLTGAVWLSIDPARAFEIVLATLVVTCPCALALATPTALAAAASTLASGGFLLVRSRLLEVLGTGAILIFDKTGTLTEGRPKVVRTDCYSDHWTVPRSLALAAALERASTHVLGRAFATQENTDEFAVHDVLVSGGQGIEACVGCGERWRIGSPDYVAHLSGSRVPPGVVDACCTRVLLGNEKEIVAQFVIGDELRVDAAMTIAALHAAGFRIMIASGDREAAVEAVARRLNINEWHAEMLPRHKVSFVRELRGRGAKAIMVGDGVNDAPVLAAADASIAVDAGTALARATADAIVLGKRLGSVLAGVRVAGLTRRIIRQNIAWAIAYNLAAVPLAASGMLAPWMAALGMSTSSLVVVLNALRLHRQSPHSARTPLTSGAPVRVRAEAAG